MNMRVRSTGPRLTRCKYRADAASGPGLDNCIHRVLAPRTAHHPADEKIAEIHTAISDRLDNQLKFAHKSRVLMKEKFEKVESKINSILLFQDTVQSLRSDLQKTEKSLEILTKKVDKLDRIINADYL
ncbi:hypothetical protein JYU34_021054 [Plutella xylostella]|uniref:Uncharacterized protein n=1 Tax=Plutella xylostella TaxID=51655 RepID=A0ABQ7PSL5_PLUXY|nr:hypothetical protein JYU34_021054 [Plutella xylostella]